MGLELGECKEVLLNDNGQEKEIISGVFKDETFWLTQSGMAELFDCTSDNISEFDRAMEQYFWGEGR